MSKVKTLFSRVSVLVIFLVSCTRVALTRMFPPPQPAADPPSAKVFALTDAAWAELRAGHEVAVQDKKSGDEQKGPSKSEDKKEPSKRADCDKGKSGDDQKSTQPGDDKKSRQPGDDKKTDSAKSGECDEGPGAGDGDMGGTGG
ncbi:MAG: hypothetical protein ACXVZJ_02265 [Terriglobales bacterium]